jgi:2-oxoglutarate dehydrogenase E1 component
MSSPITSVFNDGYIAEQYEAFRRDPASVDESFRQLFRLAESLAGTAGTAAAGPADASLLRAVAGAAGLVDAIRLYGHLAVQLDPLGTPPVGAAELHPEFHGITDADLARVPAAALGFDDGGTAADAVARLRRLYSSNMGFEFEHIEEEAEREWFRRMIEGGEAFPRFSPEEKTALLRRLTEVDGLERFLGRAFVGVKRFSIEGTDALVPMLDAAIEGAGRAGAREVVMGMAHRGRLNVLTHVVGKPFAVLFGEFEGKHITTAADTGDVKYHMGYACERELGDGRAVSLRLLPNPSHLEFVNPVINGVARALQRTGAEGDGAPAFDERAVLTIAIHGDAAFIGEGVVAETFNMSRLRGYRVGGTLHIIANNQVGFTTHPIDARSTYYASDLAKGFEIPVVHVNGDDPEACIAAVRLGIAYREKFGKDFVIDLVGYRRHGHNETDEPVWTQPTLYARIKQHPAPREVWGRRLVEQGVVTADEVQAIDREIAARLSGILDEVKGGAVPAKHGTETREGEAAPPPLQIDTRVEAATITALNERLLTVPPDFRPNQRLMKQLERRRQNLESAIDWGHAEALAFGTLVLEGHSVRVSGQDVERGTFSHRQDVLHDMESGATYIPLQHLGDLAGGAGKRGRFEIYNSPLSETAVMGFEYGYSVAAPDALTVWEAQFGDFANVAAPIIDQFLAADRAKWGQDSGLTLLLPHGYEGQGPEHSSARLERFLQLSAEGNMVVAYPSSPAQYFHILRRQAKRRTRRPLVLMQPKSLLRLPEAASSLQELATGQFRPVIDDPLASQRREQVRRLVFCTGKLYYDLAAGRAKAAENGENGGGAAVALVRIEELYPYPHDEVARIVDLYPALEEVVWAQEEPKNMGAWTYLAPRLRASTGTRLTVRYIGRPERASPAEGYAAEHTREQSRIVGESLAAPQPARRGGSAAARS